MTGIVHHELVVAHTTVRLRESHILVELITLCVLNDNLDGETTSADAYPTNDNLLVHRHLYLLHTIALVIGIDIEDGALGYQSLANQFLTGNVDIAQIGQCWHTHFIIAIVLERTVQHLIVIHPIITQTLEVDACMTLRADSMSLVNHNLIA